MVSQTLLHLIQGDKDIASCYQFAKKQWKDVRQTEAYNSVESLAKELLTLEGKITVRCGDKLLGEEIFVAVAYGQFYNDLIGIDGAIEEAQRIRKAFELSLCRSEVKSRSESISKLFELGLIQNRT